MQAAHCCVAVFTAASFRTSLAMSLLSVRMPASGPWPMASVNSWLIVLHLPIAACSAWGRRSEEHTSELQSQSNLVCRLLLEKKKKKKKTDTIDSQVGIV